VREDSRDTASRHEAADIGRADHSRDTDSSGGAESELVSRLRVIEEQPLPGRAVAYAGIHEELAKRLEPAP
jgi:hypothetical protein